MTANSAPTLTAIPLVSDIMQRSLINVFETMPIADVARLLTENRISGAPVVNEQGQVVGVISLFDLASSRRAGKPEPPQPQMARPNYYGEVWFDYDQAETYFGSFYEDQDSFFGTAADLMSPTLIEVAPSATLTSVVDRMLKDHVHRVLVTEDGCVVGLVTTMDVMRCVPALIGLAQKQA